MVLEIIANYNQRTRYTRVGDGMHVASYVVTTRIPTYMVTKPGFFIMILKLVSGNKITSELNSGQM